MFVFCVGLKFNFKMYHTSIGVRFGSVLFNKNILVKLRKNIPNIFDKISTTFKCSILFCFSEKCAVVQVVTSKKTVTAF